MVSGFRLTVVHKQFGSDEGKDSGGIGILPLADDDALRTNKRIPLVCGEKYNLVPEDENGVSTPTLALVFCPSTLTESALEQLPTERSSPIRWLVDGEQVSRSLLALIHPFLEQNFAIHAVFRSCQERLPSDLILLDLSHAPPAAITDLMDYTDNQVIRSGPEAILKVLLLASVQLSSGNNESEIMKEPCRVFPPCPVCLHRIDPWRLGLRQPQAHHQCSGACQPRSASSNLPACPRQRLLRPWPLPNRCSACGVIQTYWNGNHSFVCEVPGCSMRETLWVCLTCAFVGCGRYSNKHSVQHNTDTGHPFCLELSTCRIWSYEDGEFAHRADLLECSSFSPQPSIRGAVASAYFADEPSASHPNSKHAAASPANEDRLIAAGLASIDNKTPQKTSLIGEEYEALLQSALEDQAQHYEGEITRLRADLAEQQLDKDTMTPREVSQIGSLRAEIDQTRARVEQISHDLVDLQAKEAGNRAKSQRLLREQGIAQELLKKIHTENALEYERGRLEIEELEQQISDLTANQKMMHEFSRNQSLHNSQILFTTEQPSKQKGKRGGKKVKKRK